MAARCEKNWVSLWEIVVLKFDKDLGTLSKNRYYFKNYSKNSKCMIASCSLDGKKIVTV